MSDENKWDVKLDAFRPTTDFADLSRTISCYYEMYSRAANFVGPWVAKQRSANIFLPPDRDTLRDALGKTRSAMPFRVPNACVDNIISYLLKHKGKRTLITPNPTSHHSAQYPLASFEITPVRENVVLRDDKSIRKPAKNVHKIVLEACEHPIFVENLVIPPHQIKFLIVRPKLGKLGTPSALRWEVLFYKSAHGYLVDHVDSDLNPRYSGLF